VGSNPTPRTILPVYTNYFFGSLTISSNPRFFKVLGKGFPTLSLPAVVCVEHLILLTGSTSDAEPCLTEGRSISLPTIVRVLVQRRGFILIARLRGAQRSLLISIGSCLAVLSTGLACTSLLFFLKGGLCGIRACGFFTEYRGQLYFRIGNTSTRWWTV